MLLEALLLVVTVFLAIYWKVTRQFNFFAERGIPHIRPSFPFGSEAFKKLIYQKIKFVDLDATIIEEAPKDEKVFGFFVFGQPNFFVNDFELAKRMFIKDFDFFADRRQNESTDEILNNFLTNLSGEKWKYVRSLFSSVFTSGKLKLMTKHIVKVGDRFEEFIGEAATKDKEIVLKEACGFMTLDSIATAVFGIESDSMKNPENTFRTMALRLVGAPGYRENFIYLVLKNLFIFIMPKLAKMTNISAMNKTASNFFVDIIKKAFAQRLEGGARRNDMIDILTDEIKASKENIGKDTEQGEGKETSKVEMDTETVLISNALIFFFAGFDTTNFGLALCIHSLAVHPDHQEKVYQEISESLEHGDDELTFEKIQDLKYLDMFVSESFRVSDNITAQERQCTKDYTVPGTNIIIPKGRMVKIYTRSFNLDPQHFRNPAEFDPENFLPENQPNKFAYTTFGHGPRNCIGLRYALLTIKVALVSLLRKHRIVRCEKTGDVLTFSVKNNSFEGGIVKAVPR